MTVATLRPMTSAEYERWRPRAVAAYARDLARSGSAPADRADEVAGQQIAGLLPDGVSTLGHYLLVAEVDGSRVGHLWLHIPSDIDEPEAFVFDIEVDQELRRRGFGRAVMVAGERFARARGASAMRLHVFGHNLVARRLYENLGFAVTDVTMIKSFGRVE